MATLKPYFGPGTDGVENKIQIMMLFFWQPIGTGRFTEYNDFAFSFRGQYNVLGQQGEAGISVLLTDRNPDATTGSCAIKLNDASDDNARYQVDGRSIVVTTNLSPQPMRIYPAPDGNGTRLDNLIIAGNTLNLLVGL